MNQFKNFIITLLSILVLLQGILLLYFIQDPEARARRAKARSAALKAQPVKPVASTRPAAIPAPAVKTQPEATLAPKAAPSIVLGRIALVLDDWGYSLKNRDFIVGNNYHVTLAILPFRAYSEDVARLAFDKNKGILIHMPMEPLHREQYGLEEKTLLTTMDKSTVWRFLQEAYASVPYAQGISNHMGSKATEDERLMRFVLEFLRRRHGIYFDSYVTAKTVGPKIAKALKVKSVHRDVFIDNDSDPSIIRQQIRKLAQQARQGGVAFGIGHDRPNTIAVLKEMIPELQAEGYRFLNLDEAIAYLEARSS